MVKSGQNREWTFNSVELDRFTMYTGMNIEIGRGCETNGSAHSGNATRFKFVNRSGSIENVSLKK